jgi:hypothetical protein
VTPQDCLKELELGDSAGRTDIKRAYRRFAQQLHPDKRANDPQARQRFIRISSAYRILMQASRVLDRGGVVGTCRQCQDFGEVIVGPDGLPRCNACTLWRKRCILPMPRFTMVRCIGAIVLLLITGYLLLLGYSTGDGRYAVAAFGSGLFSLAMLAYTSLTIVHCLSRRERSRIEAIERATARRAVS